MFDLLLVASLVPAQVNSNFASWMMQNSRLRRASESVAAKLELWVDPTGKIEDCNVAHFAGAQETADRFCEKTIGRIITPGTSSSGEPVYSMIAVSLIFVEDPRLRNQLMSELQAQQPAATYNIQIVHESGDDAVDFVEWFNVVVDGTGMVADCSFPSGKGTDIEIQTCRHIAGENRTARTAQSGEPVPYVETVNVHFSTN